jgi:hypothetical protein
VPEQDLVVSVAVFRAASQWAWLPVGWVALATLRRRGVRPAVLEPGPSSARDEVA